MSNDNRVLPFDDYDEIDSILEKSEKDFNKILKWFDSLNGIKEDYELIDLDEDVFLKANPADYEDLMPIVDDEYYKIN